MCRASVVHRVRAFGPDREPILGRSSQPCGFQPSGWNPPFHIPDAMFDPICACGAAKRLRSNGYWGGKQRFRWYCSRCEAERLQQYAASMNASKRAWDRRNPIKRRAHKLVEIARLRAGLAEWSCDVCGADATHAHHSDYSNPLSVRWLCSLHHSEEHKIQRAA